MTAHCLFWTILEPGFNIKGKNTPHLLGKESDTAFHCRLGPNAGVCAPTAGRWVSHTEGAPRCPLLSLGKNVLKCQANSKMHLWEKHVK